MKTCPYCAEEIQDEAIVCRYCGRELPKPEPAAQQPAKPKSTTPLVLFSLIVVLGVVLVSVNGILGGNEERADVPTASGASIVCQQFVEDRLKSPSTAEFARISDDRVTKVADGQYKVISYVDAQNSFGAMIRTDYVCTVSYQGDDQWKLVSLDIGE